MRKGQPCFLDGLPRLEGPVTYLNNWECVDQHGRKYLKWAAAAKRIGITATTLDVQVKHGVIPITACARHMRYKLILEQEVERYIREHKGRFGRRKNQAQSLSR